MSFDELGLGELAARHAALGAAEPDHAADFCGERRVSASAKVGGGAGVEGMRHAASSRLYAL